MKIPLLIIVSLLIVGLASAVPTNGVSSDITNNHFNATCIGGSGAQWIRYGESTGQYLTYATGNQTTGNFELYGSPLMGSTTYKWSCYDSTGGDPVPHTVSLSALTPLPVSTLGATLDTIKANHFNVVTLGTALMVPFLWVFPSADLGITAVCFLLFFAAYAGLWLRGRGVAIPAILGFLLAPVMMYSNSGLGLGLPPEVLIVAQSLFYASIAGLIMSLFKKG